MDLVEMDNVVSPENFAFGVLSAAKKLYGDDAKYLPKWRSIKLVCIVADRVGFEGVPRGWYKFGEYSFKLDSIVAQYFPGNGYSLLDANIPSFDLPNSSDIYKILKDLRKHFIQKTEVFANWIHYEICPSPYNLVYRHNDELINIFEQMLNQPNQTLITGHSRDRVGEIITQYNTRLKYVPNEILNLFFDFTDILEDLLLVAKARKISVSHLDEYLIRLKNVYENKIFPCLTPFEDTIKGSGREEEIAIFRKNKSQFLADSIFELSDIKIQIKLAGLSPTIEEYDRDINEGVNDMSEKERSVLNQTFRVPIRPSL